MVVAPMQDSLVNYQIRSHDHTAVQTAAAQAVSGRAYVSDASGGWVTMCDQASQPQNFSQIDQLAGRLSADLSTAVFAFIVFGEDLFAYCLFNRGDLLDEFHSSPDESLGSMTEETRLRLAGRPGLILRQCKAGTELADIEATLGWGKSGREGGFATAVSVRDRLHHLATVLGIDPLRATLCFDDCDRFSRRLVLGKQFHAIQGGRLTRSNRGLVPPRIPPR
jgi:hypothetical protein